MPKNKDIHKILIIGSGPIIISQACEFDYSGSQALKVLKSDGFEVVLVNSNPATIMTDPEMALRTYIEPITSSQIEKIIVKERPDALLPTLGGQTALNVAVQLAEKGILEKYRVKMIGACLAAIKKAEDRQLFKKSMKKIGLEVPESGFARTARQAKIIASRIGFPLIIRPSFTLGGTGGDIAYNWEEFEEIVSRGIGESMIGEVLIEESLLGWKEYELEVMRDIKDNVVIVCSIENFDPMGIHTGDSITCAPAQTLTDKEYQLMRDAAIRIIREIGVETGGSNIQFAVNPTNGRMVVVEMNPRVSRSSALASKATGFPIAKIAAKLAVGYTLDEIPNDITKETFASFEPVLDYCVVKIPRFAFEKFPQASSTLGISMKSVGEVMAIGRNFKEALQKGLRSLEIGISGLDDKYKDLIPNRTQSGTQVCWQSGVFTRLDTREIREKLRNPTSERIFFIKYGIQGGIPLEEIRDLTKIDLWFLDNIKQIVELEEEIKKSKTISEISQGLLKKAKSFGFSDKQIADLLGANEQEVRNLRKKNGINSTYKLVDTCAAEFEAKTPYYYSTYNDTEDEVLGHLLGANKEKVLILGSGPNRIGQGIEFDYCCVHCSFVLKELGYESIMVNSNPETVSTDYDTSDKLYFEPITWEDVLNIAEKEKPIGVIVQFGGQTPINLAKRLAEAGIKIIGTSVEQIDRAEDRKKFNELINKLHLLQAPGGTTMDLTSSMSVANSVGYPVLIRPSYVLGGQSMQIIYDDQELERYISEALHSSREHPVLIDKFLEDAIEVDVDAVCDGKDVFIGGIMEHIEMAGVHSGDAAMSLPPFSLSDSQMNTIRKNTYLLARELEVVGLMNIQFAVKGDLVYVLEVNPRASRTVPFVSKAIGVPLAKIATKVMFGKTLDELGLHKEIRTPYFSVKESVFPFKRFPGVDIILGPNMKSTGEVMGIDKDFGSAYAKAEIAASHFLPTKGNVFISVRDSDKRDVVYIAKRLEDLGFGLYASTGTARVLERNGIKVNHLLKIKEGRPNPLDLIINGEINLIINTPSGKGPKTDEALIRSTAILHNVTVITTIAGAQAAIDGIRILIKQKLDVKSLQTWHKSIHKKSEAILPDKYTTLTAPNFIHSTTPNLNK